MSPADSAALRERIIKAHLKDPELSIRELAVRLGCGVTVVKAALRLWRERK